MDRLFIDVYLFWGDHVTMWPYVDICGSCSAVPYRASNGTTEFLRCWVVKQLFYLQPKSWTLHGYNAQRDSLDNTIVVSYLFLKMLFHSISTSTLCGELSPLLTVYNFLQILMVPLMVCNDWWIGYLHIRLHCNLNHLYIILHIVKWLSIGYFRFFNHTPWPMVQLYSNGLPGIFL